MIISQTLLTKDARVRSANDIYTDWAAGGHYLGVGYETPYSANDSLVPVPNNSQDYINSIYRNLIALKKITSADMVMVVPRVDWQTGVVYSQWDNTVDMYGTLTLTALPGTINVDNSRSVTGVNTTFSANLSSGNFLYLPGDGDIVAPQTLQVTDVFSNTSLNVNSAFSGNFISNTAYLVSNSAPDYSNQFYVRNSYDQVFVCLFNNGGVQSTVMPQISLGGNLPTSSYIVTSDGYKWKYLYTIPAGNKQLFFTNNWMPVYSESDVVSSAVDGRIDVVLIEAGGTGYNGNVASNTAAILTVTGDGTGANLTAVVNASGSITGINVLSGGQGYTYANVVVSTGTTGQGANLRVIIGPSGGHGFDPVSELGAQHAMMCVPLSGTEGGTLPTGASVGTGVFQYRQLSIIKDPVDAVSGNVAANLNYSMVSTVTVQALPAGSYFSIDETVYQGPSLAEATFSGTVVYWDSVNNVLWLNDIVGTFMPQNPIVGTLQTSPVTAFVLTSPEVTQYSGKVMYVNNIEAVTRGINQTEYAVAVFGF